MAGTTCAQSQPRVYASGSIREMKRARAREADRLKRLLHAAEKDRATRYAAATRGTPAEVLGTVTEVEAEAHLRAVAAADLTARRRNCSPWTRSA